MANTNSSTDFKRLNDDIVRNPNYQNNKRQSKKAYEKKINPKLETIRYSNTMQSPLKLQENQKRYDPNKNDITLNNIERKEVKKVRCSYESQSLPSHPRKTMSELMKRMKEQIKALLEHQLEVDYKIVTNEGIARDIAAKLSNLAGDKEVDKFNLHVKELESVHNLVLGLAARLAKVEENIELLKDYNSVKCTEILGFCRKNRLSIAKSQSRDTK